MNSVILKHKVQSRISTLFSFPASFIGYFTAIFKKNKCGSPIHGKLFPAHFLFSVCNIQKQIQEMWILIACCKKFKYLTPFWPFSQFCIVHTFIVCQAGIPKHEIMHLLPLFFSSSLVFLLSLFGESRIFHSFIMFLPEKKLE